MEASTCAPFPFNWRTAESCRRFHLRKTKYYVSEYCNVWYGTTKTQRAQRKAASRIVICGLSLCPLCLCGSSYTLPYLRIAVLRSDCLFKWFSREGALGQ